MNNCNTFTVFLTSVYL